MTLFDIQLCLKLVYPLDYSTNQLKSKTPTPQSADKSVEQQELIHCWECKMVQLALSLFVK